MALSFSQELQTIISSGWCGYHPFVELTLNDGTVLRYSTINVTVDGLSYDDRLKNVSGGKIGLTSSVDRTNFTLYNADALVGNQMLTTRTPLENVRAVIGTIYSNIQNSSQTYKIIEDDGIVNASNATDEILECTFISSTYTERSILGDIIVDKNCPYQYKSSECGYTGALPTCDRSFSGLNGCNVHFDFETAKLQFGGAALFLDDSYVQQVQKTIPTYNRGKYKKNPDDDELLPDRYYRSY